MIRKLFALFLLAVLPSFTLLAAKKQVKEVKAVNVERWGMYETRLKAHAEGNPFDVDLTATFVGVDTTYCVEGFYDGDDTYVIRFMPTREGEWKYSTRSSLAELSEKTGSFVCVPAKGDNHGPVVPDGMYAFKYADGKRYYPVGTTSYDWMHAVGRDGKSLQSETITSLEEAGFNKIRQLLLPHNFDPSYPEPNLFPFEMVSVNKDEKGKLKYEWDYSRPNPAFFRNIEHCVEMLQNIGYEADMCMMHPYDEGRWGFDAMPEDVTCRYLRYATKRLAAYRNIWWSLANEYDLLKEQPKERWTNYIDAVMQSDPYRHMISIHSYTAQYYNYWDERLTHCSIQDQAPVEDFGRAPIVRNIYRKPVIFDEVCYEGDMTARFGDLSGEEMLYRMWMGLVNGTYVTHAECYQNGDPHDFYDDFLAVGGKWQGEAWKRIKFMREILDDLPEPMYLADSSWDPFTTAAGPGYYIVYLGHKCPASWRFDLPSRNGRTGYPRLQEGEKYKVDIIDTWNMTITPLRETFELKRQDNYRMVDKALRSIRLPQQPYMMLRIKRVE